MVRLIKSSERQRLQQEGAKTETRKSSPQQAVRAMAATVSRWINEAQQKRLDESRLCRERLGRQHIQSGA